MQAAFMLLLYTLSSTGYWQNRNSVAKSQLAHSRGGSFSMCPCGEPWRIQKMAVCLQLSRGEAGQVRVPASQGEPGGLSPCAYFSALQGANCWPCPFLDSACASSPDPLMSFVFPFCFWRYSSCFLTLLCLFLCCTPII